jgi:hypothetical protein
MKKLISIILLIGLVFSFTACEYTAEEKQTQATQQSLAQMNNEIGMPDITEFTAKKTLNQIYKIQDDSKLICYAYHMNEYTGKYVYDGKCMGFAIPYSTQYTNPETRVYNGSGVTLPQADPDGLYHSSSTAGTWVIMIDEVTGKRNLTFCEPNVVVSEIKKPARLCETWSLPSDY